MPDVCPRGRDAQRRADVESVRCSLELEDGNYQHHQEEYVDYVDCNHLLVAINHAYLFRMCPSASRALLKDLEVCYQLENFELRRWAAYIFDLLYSFRATPALPWNRYIHSVQLITDSRGELLHAGGTT